MTEDKSLEDFLPNKNGSYFKEFNNALSNILITEEDVIKCIKTVMDPEIPVNLYDLGLIYSIKINKFGHTDKTSDEGIFDFEIDKKYKKFYKAKLTLKSAKNNISCEFK